MKLRYFFHVTRYIMLLANGKFEKIDHLLLKEKNREIKYYISFQRFFYAKSDEMCYKYLVMALDEKCAHWNAIKIYTRNVLATDMQQKKYNKVEIEATKLLSYNELNKGTREYLFQLLGNAFYYQNKPVELGNLVKKLIFEEKIPEHPIAQWYMKNKRKIDEKTEEGIR